MLVLESIHPAGVKYLSKFAQVEHLINRPRAAVLAALGEVDTVVCKSVTRVNRDFIKVASNSKLVGRAGAGPDNFDEVALLERGIPLITVPTGNSVSAAEFAVMVILMLVKNAPPAVDAVRRGDFRRDFLELRELSCMTVGLIGFGNVGRIVTERLLSFGCTVLAHDDLADRIDNARYMGVRFLGSPEELLAQIDVISLHATLNEKSEGVINRRTLACVKTGSWLVNTARGRLMVDHDVLDALDQEVIAGLAIDTLTPEPPLNREPEAHSYSHPYLNHEKVLVFPHMAAPTSDAQERIALMLADTCLIH